MITNSNKLKGKMVENGLNVSTLAEKLGMSQTTLRFKINNKREFYIEEAESISKILNLTDKEMILLFFSRELKENEK